MRRVVLTVSFVVLAIAALYVGTGACLVGLDLAGGGSQTRTDPPGVLAFLVIGIAGALGAFLCYRGLLRIGAPEVAPPASRQHLAIYLCLGWLALFSLVVALVVLLNWGAGSFTAAR
ncbi:MAG: hypothetical protein ACK47B_11105 [Armatimonadota bacterium]